MHYASTAAAMNYLPLTRDSTESDLKQRREIVNHTLIYIDQSIVAAALAGNIMIIDGLEKAERNILPLINNLLENREIALEDGRFLTSPKRYDELLLQQQRQKGDDPAKQTLAQIGLVRVHENFRVVALGIPVPPFLGNPLDPPLRSRFQVPATTTHTHTHTHTHTRSVIHSAASSSCRLVASSPSLPPKCSSCCSACTPTLYIHLD